MHQIYHRYEKWEDFRFGMWRDLGKGERAVLVERCLNFIRETDLFRAAMNRVIKEWPICSEHNLSNVKSNRRSWIGQAACSIELNCPEDITREAWGLLDPKLQIKANKSADKIIRKWELLNETKNYQLHFYMGTERLSRRDTRRGRPKVRSSRISSLISSNMQGNLEERFSFDEPWIQ